MVAAEAFDMLGCGFDPAIPHILALSVCVCMCVCEFHRWALLNQKKNKPFYMLKITYTFVFWPSGISVWF